MAGTVGGAALVFVGYPFDTVTKSSLPSFNHSRTISAKQSQPASAHTQIKVRLQTMNTGSASSGPARFSGALDCLAKTIQREGVRGLFKGMTSPLTGMREYKPSSCLLFRNLSE